MTNDKMTNDKTGEPKPDDIVRVEINGRDRIMHYIRGDEHTMTLTPDPYNERGEETYKRSDVIIKDIIPYRWQDPG